MSRPRSVQLGALLLIAAAVAAGLLLRPGALTTRALAEGPSAPGSGRTLPHVGVTSPERRTIRRVVRLPADVLALSDATIYGRVPGYVKEVRVEVGSRATPLEILAVIEVPELDAAQATAEARLARAGSAVGEARAAVAIAKAVAAESGALELDAENGIARTEAERDRAQAELEYRASAWRRLEALLAAEPASVSKDRADEARGASHVAEAEVGVAAAKVRSARSLASAAAERTKASAARVVAAAAALASAVADEASAKAVNKEVEVRRAFATVRAPFACLVTQRHMDPGDFVREASGNSGAMPILQLVDDSRMRIRFRVADVDAAACQPTRAFRLVVDGVPGREFQGQVARVAESLDLASRSMLVEGEIDNSDRALRHGMFGRVFVDLEAHENALVVPAEAVTTAKRKSSVLVVESGRVVKRSVKIGVDDGVLVEILDGLQPADSVIVVGTSLVTPGETVVAVSAAPT